MKSVHVPRRRAVLLLILLAVVFLYGNVQAFSELPLENIGRISILATTSTPASGGLPAVPPSADTTGILILGILLVAIILIGLLWGGRRLKK